LGNWMCGSWNLGRNRIEALGFDGSMSSPLGSGAASPLGPGRLLAGSVPGACVAARGAWVGAEADGRAPGAVAGAGAETADVATDAGGVELRSVTDAGGVVDADGAEAAGGVAAFGARTGGPEAGEAAGELARAARRFPACVLPSPGNGGPETEGEAAGVACAVLTPPGSRRAAHFGLFDGP
jgi:hypothetical protein